MKKIFKRTLSILLTLTMLSGFAVFSSAADTGIGNNVSGFKGYGENIFGKNKDFSVSGTARSNAETQPGDADKDGKITAADARLALRASVGLEDKTAELINIADMDNDGNITAADARLILRKSVGLTEKSEELFAATKAEINRAGIDLYNILYYSNDINTAVDFDCKNMTYKKFLDEWFMHQSGLSFLYYDYFGKIDVYCSPYAEDSLTYYVPMEFEKLNRVPKSDPLNKLFDKNNMNSDINTGLYYKYSKEKIDWIVKNILNLSDEEINNSENYNYIKIYSDEYTEPYTESYMYNGSFYVRMTTGFGGNLLLSEPVLIDYKRLNDGKYEFRFKEVVSDGCEDYLDPGKSPEDYEFYLTAVMGLKEIDGKRYWSVYSVKTHKN